MPLLELLLIVAGILVILFLLSQVIVPFVSGTAFFPIFGTKLKADLKHAEWELEDLAEAEKLKAMQDEINARWAKLKEKK